MQVLVLYFSGTGNTEFIAERITEYLKAKNCNFDLCSVENFNPSELKFYDFLIFGFPIYAHDLPSFLKDYIKKLSLPKNRGVILYSTAGKNGGNAIRNSAKLFAELNFIPVFTREFKMPANDSLLAEEKNSKKVKQIINTDFTKIEILNKAAAEIAEKAKYYSKKDLASENIKLPKRKLLATFIDPTIKLTFKLLKKWLASKFRTDEKCTLCGHCEKICPADNIVIQNEEVKFSDKCYLCLRCVNQCPEEAIQISKLTKGNFRYQGPAGDYGDYIKKIENSDFKK